LCRYVQSKIIFLVCLLTQCPRFLWPLDIELVCIYRHLRRYSHWYCYVIFVRGGPSELTILWASIGSGLRASDMWPGMFGPSLSLLVHWGEDVFHSEPGSAAGALRTVILFVFFLFWTLQKIKTICIYVSADCARDWDAVDIFIYIYTVIIYTRVHTVCFYRF